MSTELKALFESASMSDITPEREEAMTQYALTLFDRYRKDAGWASAGVYMQGSWLWRRAAAAQRFGDNFSDRLMLPPQFGGDLYKLSNLSLNMPRRFIEDHHARIAADLEAKGFFALVPDTEEDQNPALKLFEQYLQAKASRSKLAESLKNDGELQALIRGEQVYKIVEGRTQKKRWQHAKLLLVNGRPLKDSSGGYVTEFDKWEEDPEHPGQDRLCRDHLVYKTTGVMLPMSDKTKRVMSITSDVTGADVSFVYFADFVADLSAPSLDASLLKGQCFAMAWDDLCDLYSQNSRITKAGEDYRDQNSIGANGLNETTDALQPRKDESIVSILPDQGAQQRQKYVECWIKYDYDGCGRREDICVTFDHQKRVPVRYEIAQEVLASEDRTHPFGVIRVHPVHERWYGTGYYERHNDLSESADRDYNRLELEKLTSGKIIAVKRSGFEETKAGQKLTLRGPKLWHLDGQTTMDEAVGVTTIKPELEGIQACLNLTLQTLQSEGGGVTPGETEGAGLEGANTATGLQILQETKNQKVSRRQDEINAGIQDVLRLFAQIEADVFDDAFAKRLFKDRQVEIGTRPVMMMGADDFGNEFETTQPMMDAMGQPVTEPVMADAVETLKAWLSTVQPDVLQNMVKMVLSRSRSTQVVRTNDNILKLVESWMRFPPEWQKIMQPAFIEMYLALEVPNPERFVPIAANPAAAGPMGAASPQDAAPSAATADAIPTGRPMPNPDPESEQPAL